MYLMITFLGQVQGVTVDEEIRQLFPDIFEGIGKFLIKVHLNVDPSEFPIVQGPRRVPDTIKPKLCTELDRMEKLGVIHKLAISELTDWLHNLLIVTNQMTKSECVWILQQ